MLFWVILKAFSFCLCNPFCCVFEEVVLKLALFNQWQYDIRDPITLRFPRTAGELPRTKKSAPASTSNASKQTFSAQGN